MKDSAADIQLNLDMEQDAEADFELDASAGKRKSMSSAFAKILSKKSKGDIPILSERKTGGSSGLSAEQRKEKELRKKILQNRRQKLDIRERGHVKEVQYGADPEQDKLEKHLVRTATKGVVKLFNAIYQAQKQHQKAGRDRDMARQAKSNLLDQLQGAARNVSEIEGGVARQTTKADGRSHDEGKGSGGGAGWDVLNDGFTGLSGRKKLKDWDREEEANLEEQMETIQDEDEDESESEEEFEEEGEI